MNYCGLNKCDTTNGDGCRVSLFVSGCSLHCKGCFNKEAWDRTYGDKFTVDVLEEVLEALGEPYIKGLSILGGDPLEEYNRGPLVTLCSASKSLYPNKDIWLWTGRNYDTIDKVQYGTLLKYVDVIIDGPFIEKLKEPDLKWRGSSNQRIIKLHKGIK